MLEKNWEEEIKQEKKKELLIISALLVVVGVGIGSEIVSRCSKGIHYVLNYDAVSLVVIQVQATVFTLTIALIALLVSRGELTEEETA